MFQPRFTMNGFELQEQRSIDGTGYVRALRVLLTANLPTLQPRIQEKISQAFKEYLSEKSPNDGMTLLQKGEISSISHSQ